jgi:hypothetical protein
MSDKNRIIYLLERRIVLYEPKIEGETNSILEKYFKGLFIWAKVILVSEKTFRQVYKRDLALV